MANKSKRKVAVYVDGDNVNRANLRILVRSLKQKYCVIQLAIYVRNSIEAKRWRGEENHYSGLNYAIRPVDCLVKKNKVDNQLILDCYRDAILTVLRLSSTEIKEILSNEYPGKHDAVAIFTGDSDFIALINTLKESPYSKEIIGYKGEKNISRELIKAFDKVIDIKIEPEKTFCKNATANLVTIFNEFPNEVKADTDGYYSVSEILSWFGSKVGSDQSKAFFKENGNLQKKRSRYFEKRSEMYDCVWVEPSESQKCRALKVKLKKEMPTVSVPKNVIKKKAMQARDIRAERAEKISSLRS